MDILDVKAQQGSLIVESQYDASYFIKSYIDYLKEVIKGKEQLIRNQEDVIAMLRCDNEDEKQDLINRIEELEGILKESNKEYNDLNIRLNRSEEQNKKLLYVIGGVFHNGVEVDATTVQRYNEGMERLKTIGLSITDLKF